MLLGLGLLALPVLAHLTGYREVRRVEFPTLRFLVASQVKSRKRTRLESLLLLLIRLLLVSVLVLLLSRPSAEWTTASLAGLDPTRPSVILVDVSASSSVEIDGVPLSGLIVEEAKTILNALAEGTPAAVLAFDDRTRVVGQGLSGDHAVAHRALDELTPGAGATDLNHALRRARSMLRDQGLGIASIFVLSDGTATELPSGLAEGWPEGFRVHYYDLRGGAPHNHFIDEATVRPPGVQGSGLRIDVAAVAVGEVAAEVTPLALRLSEGLEVHQDLRFVEGEVETSFSLPMTSAGDQKAVLELAADVLPIDDVYPFVLRGDKSIEVLLVSGEGGTQPRDDEAYFVENALQPGPGSPSRVHPRVVSAEALREVDGGRGDVVFLCNVTDPRPIADDLVAMVEDGGGLFISVGRRIDPDLYNEALSDLLPARFTEVKTRGSGSFEISPVGLALPPLDRDEFRVFRTGGASVFSQVRFGRMIATEPSLAEDSEVLLRYTDGMPALLERKVGKGRVILFTSTVDDDWTDLPLRSIFVPLVHQIARSLGNSLVQDGGAVVEVGQHLPLSLPPGQRRIAWLRGPSGEEVRLDPVGADEEGLLMFSEARSPGHYSLFWSDPSSGEEEAKATFSVRVPKRESRLTKVSAEALHAALPGLVFHGRAEEQATSDSTGEVVRKTSLLPALWMILLLVLVAEASLSLRHGS